jgi:hypothetical protein
MMVQHDYAAERLARVTLLLHEAHHAKAQMAPTDRALARQLVIQLDQMLREFGPPALRRES